jgi:hypothetical protein
MLKKTVICFAMIGVVVLAVASSGGGSKKKTSLKSGFTPVRTTQGLTLKAGPHYMGSRTFSTQKNHTILYNTLVTYQKGNTIYILPYKYKGPVGKTTSRNNLNALDLKIRLRK